MRYLLKVLFYLITIPLGILIAILVTLAVFNYNASYLSLSGKKFNKEIWKKGDDERCAMYKDLTKNYIRRGMNQNQLIELLEEPSATRYSRHKRIKALTFYGGNCKKNLIEGTTSKSLLIYVIFDKKNNVVRTLDNYKNQKDIDKLFEVWCSNYRNDCDCNLNVNGKIIKKRDILKTDLLKECGVEAW
jgi:hypothetical protein